MSAPMPADSSLRGLPTRADLVGIPVCKDENSPNGPPAAKVDGGRDEKACDASRLASPQVAPTADDLAGIPVVADWLVEQRIKFEKENNAYAAALHRSFEQQARGVVAVDYNQFDKAYWHFVAAALLKPPVPKAVEIVPLPKK